MDTAGILHLGIKIGHEVRFPELLGGGRKFAGELTELRREQFTITDEPGGDLLVLGEPFGRGRPSVTSEMAAPLPSRLLVLMTPCTLAGMGGSRLIVARIRTCCRPCGSISTSVTWPVSTHEVMDRRAVGDAVGAIGFKGHRDRVGRKRTGDGCAELSGSSTRALSARPSRSHPPSHFVDYADMSSHLVVVATGGRRTGPYVTMPSARYNESAICDLSSGSSSACSRRLHSRRPSQGMCPVVASSPDRRSSRRRFARSI
jgi:hypothetical protein